MFINWLATAAGGISHHNFPHQEEMSTQMLDWHPSKVLGTNVYQQPVKLWDLRAGLSACKMCPYGAHPHLAVFWPCPQATVMCAKWKLADKHAARDHLIRHQRRCQQPQDEVRPYMDVYLVKPASLSATLPSKQPIPKLDCLCLVPGGTLRASTLTNHVKPMTASWCGTPGRTQGKPALPWSQVGQWGGPTTHHDHVMVVARLVAPKASQRYLGPRFGLMGTPCHQVAA
ncbi:hypothetical protein EMCRGX_G001048 [Ephydatia muelleri]